MDQLGSSKFFTSLDLYSSYWYCYISEENISKTVFLTQYRLYKWIAMPMGLMNEPATFMQAMNNLFLDMLDKGVVVFLDDILIYSIMAEEHFILLEKVFTCLYRYEFYCKLK